MIENGALVTVDAGSCKVYEGDLCGDLGKRPIRLSLADSPAVSFLKKAARFIIPLNLTDPERPDFIPSGCKSKWSRTWAKNRTRPQPAFLGSTASGKMKVNVVFIFTQPANMSQSWRNGSPFLC